MSLGGSVYQTGGSVKRSPLKFLNSSRRVHKRDVLFLVFLLLSYLWLREPGEEVMGGRRRRRQGKEREGGSERAEEGRAWRAGAERRPNWAHGSRRLLTIPGRRAAGRLLLPFSQALGPWGSHGLRACLPRRSASLLPLAERRRLPLASLSSTPGAAGPSSPQPEPGSSHTRSLTSSGERPPEIGRAHV